LGCARKLDLLSIHHYYKAGHSTEFTESEYYTLMAEALKLEARIVRDTHLIRFFEGDDPGRVGLAIDEWGVWHPDAENPGLYQPNTLRDALSATILFDVFNRHCDSVHMTNIAQTMNVLQALIQTAEEKMWRTPTYCAYMLYRPHRGQEALRSLLECDEIGVDDGRSVPHVSASASREGSDLFVTLTNLHLTEAAEISVSVLDRRLDDVNGSLLTADAANAVNSAEEPDSVDIVGASPAASEGVVTCELPPMSCMAVSAQLY
jgi:alpha-N-arabinofuranosidase